MVKLKVKHFGPIKEGYTENDGYLAIPDVTLFIGDQGSGKSSIAKILSTCSWIEKTMLKDHFIYGQETIKELKAIENRFSNKRFMNIVEEMEQNLYPKSQQNVLYDLIRCVNSMPGNSLVLTTHSPYVINYLSLAIKAYTIHNKIRQQKESLIQKLDNIVPIESIISGERVIIYELDQSGTIRKLTTFGDGVPSDENFLNDSLRISNEKTTLRL